MKYRCRRNFKHAPPPVHASLPGLALAVFKALGSGRTLVVLNLYDLGDAAVDRVPDRGVEVRKIGGRNGSGVQVRRQLLLI